MSRSLLVVGINARALAQSAVWAGYDVLAIDAFGHLDHPELGRCLSLARDLGGLPVGATGDWMRRINWMRRAVHAAGAQPPQGLAYAGDFERAPDLVAALAARFELIGNPPEVLRAVRDPAHLAGVLKGQGLAAADDPAPEGRLHSAAFLANGREAVVFAVTRRLSANPDFGAADFAPTGHLLIPRPDPALMERLAGLAHALTRAFGLVGLNGIDFLLDGANLSVIDVTPRFCASMELYEEAVATPLFGYHALGCQGQPLPRLPQPAPRAVFGKAVVYARGDGLTPDTTRWLVKGWRDVPPAGQPYRAGMPLCTVTASASNPQRCYQRLLSQAQVVWKSSQPLS